MCDYDIQREHPARVCHLFLLLVICLYLSHCISCHISPHAASSFMPNGLASAYWWLLHSSKVIYVLAFVLVPFSDGNTSSQFSLMHWLQFFLEDSPQALPSPGSLLSDTNMRNDDLPHAPSSPWYAYQSLVTFCHEVLSYSPLHS